MSPITANPFIIKRKMIPVKLFDRFEPLTKFSCSDVPQYFTAASNTTSNFLGLNTALSGNVVRYF